MMSVGYAPAKLWVPTPSRHKEKGDTGQGARSIKRETFSGGGAAGGSGDGYRIKRIERG
jgi:hypothetical protein